jgi:hypoxanthine phosphoribosyltransferase
LETLSLTWSSVIDIKNITIGRYKKYNADKQVDYIVAVKRGGLWLGKCFSRELNIPLKTIHVSFRHGLECNEIIYPWNTNYLIDKNILVIDDIYDSGKTIRRIKENIKCKELSSVFLLTKNPFIYPSIWGAVVRPELWIKFPWENKFESPLRFLQNIKYNYLIS